MYIPGTTYLHILLHCTLYLIAHLTPYFISYLSLISFSPYLYIYIYSLVFCFIVFIAFMLLCFIFYFLHFPLSGPVLINISLPIIPCMIMYVTNNKEPWTTAEHSPHFCILFDLKLGYKREHLNIDSTTVDYTSVHKVQNHTASNKHSSYSCSSLFCSWCSPVKITY